MLAGLDYKHYKGGSYEFICVALPYERHSLEALGDNVSTYQVFDTEPIEEGDTLQVWQKEGIMLVDHMTPCVIYRSYVDYDDGREREYCQTWARKVNDFFGHVTIVDGLDVKLVPRFTINYDPNVSANLTKQTVAVGY